MELIFLGGERIFFLMNEVDFLEEWSVFFGRLDDFLEEVSG